MKLLGLIQYCLLLFFVWGKHVCSGNYGERLKSSQDILFRTVEAVRSYSSPLRGISASHHRPNLHHTPLGFVSVTHFFGNKTHSDSTCSAPSIVSGIAANYCKAGVGYWYMFELVEDSCVGAMVHYFDDDKCSLLSGTSHLASYADRCDFDDSAEFDHRVYTTLRCTTAHSASIPSTAYLINTHLDNSCKDSTIAFDAYAANECIFLSKTQQLYVNTTLSDAPSAQIYTANDNCAGQPTLIRPLSVAECNNNQYDDNHSLDPYLHPTTAQTVPYTLTLTDMLTVSTQGVCIYASVPDDGTDSAGLSGGAIAGIVIGTLIGAAILVYVGCLAYQRYYVYKAIATALDYPLAPPAGTEMSARLLSADEAVRYELEV